MKKIFGTILLGLMGSMSVFAQDNTTETPTEKKNIRKPSQDHIMIQLSHDRWAGAPDSVNTGGLGRGVSVYLCYDFPIKKSNFSFGAGVGITSNNIYFKNQRMVLNGRTGSVVFTETDKAIFKGQKLNTTYVEAPLELRYFANKNNRNTGFKFAIGAKVGFNGLGGAHFKEKESIEGKFVTYKTNTKRYMQTWRLTPTVRIGYGNFSVFAQYTVTPLFNTGAGPEDIRPMSFGICISGL
ncbi:hypothetical protein D3C72_885430 [compost metagenome]